MTALTAYAHALQPQPMAWRPDTAAPFTALPGIERMLPAGAVLRRAGNTPQLGLVLRGWLAQRLLTPDGRKHTLRLLLPGDVFGIEMLTGQPTRTTTHAITGAVCRLISSDAAESAFEGSDAFRLAVLSLLGAQQAATDLWLAALMGTNAEERTAILLLDLHSRLMARGLAAPSGFDLPLTQAELGAALGLHNVHTNRVLARLNARKLIDSTPPRITILDYDGLAALAGTV